MHHAFCMALLMLACLGCSESPETVDESMKGDGMTSTVTGEAGTEDASTDTRGTQPSSEEDSGEPNAAAPNSADQDDTVFADQPETTKAPLPPQMYSPEAFRDAALKGKLRVVERCLKSGMDVNEIGAEGFSALAMAAYGGHNDIVKVLLRAGAKVDARDREKMTPLFHAASGPAPNVVATLLDAGAEINAVGGAENYTPLMMASAENQLEVVKLLLARGADQTMVDDDGENALDFARQKGNREVVAYLQSFKAPE
ncbi:MAG: ankyrin repeat domain-containing protein [Planctomycetota bacterium]